MAWINAEVTPSFKNKVITFIANSDGRWTTQSHFLREAAVRLMEEAVPQPSLTKQQPSPASGFKFPSKGGA
jgi:hypothetical protein